jgi:S-adenosylmethionine:tRNA-ribosyltransferase-isomerase (queuine synthetase)
VYHRCQGGCIFIQPEAFRTMEPLLAKRVYQCGRGGCIFIQPGACLTMKHLLATKVILPASSLLVRQATIIYFYIGF